MTRLFAAIFCALLYPAIAMAQVQEAPITVDKINHFALGDPSKTQFGKMRFVGGLVMRSSNPHFGGISGVRISNDGEFIAVADTGFWVRGKLTRDAKGVPESVSNCRIAPVLNGDGQPFQHKWSADIEAVTIGGDGIYASAEMDMRVLRFPSGQDLFSTPSQRLTGDIPQEKLNRSFSFEAIATFPDDHPLAPALLVLAETDASGDENAPGFIVKNKQLLKLGVAQSNGYQLTDADFLPDGDLLILERRFAMGTGVAMRIRRIAGGAISPGAQLDGEVILEAGRGHVIDNMEALSVFYTREGGIRIGLMSDNNHWLMQRTLYLEFELEK